MLVMERGNEPKGVGEAIKTSYQSAKRRRRRQGRKNLLVCIRHHSRILLSISTAQHRELSIHHIIS
jgi:hypothetical protein